MSTKIKALCIALLLSMPAAASAQIIVAKVDVSDQQMKVYVGGKLRHKWPVSTARAGKGNAAWRLESQVVVSEP